MRPRPPRTGGDHRPAVDVGLDATHDVVLAGADQDRLGRDVDAGEVLADVTISRSASSVRFFARR